MIYQSKQQNIITLSFILLGQTSFDSYRIIFRTFKDTYSYSAMFNIPCGMPKFFILDT